MSDVNRPARRLSHEMRLLIVTIVVAGGVLLLLARLRFPEPPVTLDTSTPPLERLAARASFEELATRVARLETSIAPNLIVLSLTPEGTSRPLRLSDAGGGAETFADVRHVAALRIDATTASACISPHARIGGIVGQSAATETAAIVGVDPVRHVAQVRVPEGRPVAVRQLALSSLQTPTYVLAVEGTRAGVTVRPVFLGRSDRFTSPRWTRPLLPLGGAFVTSGALMFSLDAEYLGCAVLDEGTLAIASAIDVLEASRRASSTKATLADPGIAVQTVTPAIAAATGAAAGVVVAEVIEGGDASGVLEPGDVIIETDGQPVREPKALLLDLGARLAAGPVRLTFLRRRQVRHGELLNRARAAPSPGGGAQMRLEFVRGAGARVIGVNAGSPLAAAGLTPQDVILRIGAVIAPTPAQVASALRDGDAGPFLLLVVLRGSNQHVTAVRMEDRSDAGNR